MIEEIGEDGSAALDHEVGEVFGAERAKERFGFDAPARAGQRQDAAAGVFEPLPAIFGRGGEAGDEERRFPR